MQPVPPFGNGLISPFVDWGLLDVEVSEALNECSRRLR